MLLNTDMKKKASHFFSAPTSQEAMPLQTVGRCVSCTGHGVHSAHPARLTLSPAPAGTGIVFYRTDVNPEHASIPARWDLVSDAIMCTKLTNLHGISISTVEHVVAACVGMGITDVLISVDGPEVPIMDGSSAVFVEMIQDAGCVTLSGVRKTIRILSLIEVVHGQSMARFTPGLEPKMTMKFNANGRLGDALQTLIFYPELDSFATLLADARTFGFYDDAQKLLAAGFAKGASLDNTVVLNADGVMNADGLRFDDELIAHKMLDAIGDLALSGVRIIGHFEGVNSGHALNNKLLRALFATPSAWQVI